MAFKENNQHFNVKTEGGKTMNRFHFARTMEAAIALVFYALLLASPMTSAAAVTTATPPGTPWAWGLNDFGQLGDGTTTDSSVPVQVSNLTGVVAVATGGVHSLALDSNGDVWAWGANFVGQLGDGTTTNSSVPVQVVNLTGSVAVAGGGNHSLALDSNGNVWAWGEIFLGGAPSGSTVPVQVSNLTGVVAVAAGGDHSLALDSNGNVWAWGYNAFGQLGDGTTTDSSVPVQVSNLTGVVVVAAGGDHSLAITLPPCDSKTETRLSDWCITLGQNIRDKAAVTNEGKCSTAPTGTVTFEVSVDGRLWTGLGAAKTLHCRGKVTSDPFLPQAAGTSYFRAV
jgi:alpha-tubulin suppressor-like RCC1 family protein